MKYNQFNSVPSWCPYTPIEISNTFEFDLHYGKGLVKYKCVHCRTEKQTNINSIRMYIRKGVFTSLCSKCRGIIQRKAPETFIVKKVPIWMMLWLKSKKLSITELENNLNLGEIVDVYQGTSLNRGIKFKCVKCYSNIFASISRIKSSIKHKKYTGLCNKCLSGVKNNVSIDNPKICDNGYVLIQKSLVPKEHHSLCNWAAPVMIHRYKMAVKLGRPLTQDEIVHHIDGNKQNNNIENLELWNKSHPPGQRVVDKINWALNFLQSYNPNFNIRSYKCQSEW